MKSKISIRTGAWYGDAKIDLQVPSAWDVEVLWPLTPPPLSAIEMANILEKPLGQASLTEQCTGRSRPLIIVDDLNRPTPASEIMPILLKSICAANIPLENITILMATGSHGKPGADAITKKVGQEAAACRLRIHDCFADVQKIGVTTFGTPVFVNKEIVDSDILIGVGGIYPNHSAGFGGGSKLALGVLGIRTIYQLHFSHRATGWGKLDTHSDFRRELDEISKMIGMETNISIIIDANRNIIRMYCGDYKKYFSEAVSFYLETFSTIESGDADVIISNTYPNDLSLTFARMKGFVPLDNCRRGASRIAIAFCNEGLGLHNVWPFVNVPRLHKIKHVLRILPAMSLREIMSKIYSRMKQTFISCSKKIFVSHAQDNDCNEALNPVWLYRTGNREVSLPSNVPGIIITSEWMKITEAVYKEQSRRDKLRVLVYPCAYLQVPRGSDMTKDSL